MATSSRWIKRLRPCPPSAPNPEWCTHEWQRDSWVARGDTLVEHWSCTRCSTTRQTKERR